jgi:hypothetical protein
MRFALQIEAIMTSRIEAPASDICANVKRLGYAISA